MQPPGQQADPTSCHRYPSSCRRDRKLVCSFTQRRVRPAERNCPRTRQSRWFGVTMGSMSASDAAPLPRLGEVFFDVRGKSRSMRLSWYPDTRVAVLSIWQGGMCTGTFRLAIAGLPSMVQPLQRGPGGLRPEWDAETPDSGPAAEPGPSPKRRRAMPPLPREDLLAESEGPRTGAADYPARPPDDPPSASPPYRS